MEHYATLLQSVVDCLEIVKRRQDTSDNQVHEMRNELSKIKHRVDVLEYRVDVLQQNNEILQNVIRPIAIQTFLDSILCSYSWQPLEEKRYIFVLRQARQLGDKYGLSLTEVKKLFWFVVHKHKLFVIIANIII